MRRKQSWPKQVHRDAVKVFCLRSSRTAVPLAWAGDYIPAEITSNYFCVRPHSNLSEAEASHVTYRFN